MIENLSRVIIKANLEKVCIPLRVKSFQEAIRLAQRARKKGIKYLEIWLDSLPGDPVLSLLGKPRNQKFLHPYIAVCKGRHERGSFLGSEMVRMDVLMSAAFSGADFVDIGIEIEERLLRHVIRRIKKGSQAKIILSYHNFHRTPDLSSLLKICQRAFQLGADIVKIATQVNKWSDNVILFELMSTLKSQGEKAIVVGMGEKGILARVGCLMLGGFLTYVALTKQRKTAPGQFQFVSLPMQEDFRLQRSSAKMQ